MKRGEISPWELIIGVIVLLLTAGILIWALTGGAGRFKDSLSCEAADGTLTCHDNFDCSELEGGKGERHMWNLFGCGEGQTCCKVPKGSETQKKQSQSQSNTGTTGGTGGTTTPTDVTKVATATIIVTDEAQRTVSSGSTITLLPGQPRTLVFAPRLPTCIDCTWEVNTTITTPTGVVAQTAETEFYASEAPTTISNAQGPPQPYLLQFNLPEKYSGQTVTYTYAVRPRSKDGKSYGAVSTTSLSFKIDSPISYSGLNSQWSKSKTVTIQCERNKPCETVAFKIFTQNDIDQAAGACPSPGTETPTSYKIEYFVFKDGQMTRPGYPTLDACYDSITQSSDEQYRGSVEEMIKAINANNIGPNIAIPFQQQESRVSAAACKADASETERGKLFKVDGFNTETQRGTLVLDKSFVSNQYLCVYGKVRGDTSGRWYSAGAPQRIAVDTIPPKASVEFSPTTLMIRFRCEDGDPAKPEESSGCDENFGIAYVSEVSKFFPALMSRDPQSAARWCPQYLTGTGYRSQAQREAVYRSNEVRVLCVRAVDKAGNPAVAMTTVYNSYDMLAQVLSQYVVNN